MGAEDIQRINDLLEKICETLGGRSRKAILDDYPKSFDTILNISDEDLKFLSQQNAITIKIPEEIVAEHGIKPEDCRELIERRRSFFYRRQTLDEEIPQLKKRLSRSYRLLNKKTIISQREKDLMEKEAQKKSLEISIDSLSKIYSAMAKYVLTDKGVYISLNPKIHRYADLNFQPLQVVGQSNSITGKFVIFCPERGDIWNDESSYNSTEYGENFELRMHIPYQELTECSENKEEELKLKKRVIKRFRDCIDTFIEGTKCQIGGLDYMDFSDKIFFVQMHPTLSNVKKDERIRIGTTTVLDAAYTTSDFPNYDKRIVDLYTRIVEGEFTFDLTFRRVTSSLRYAL
ncbi:MAG: hypothetical protein V1802_03155 [Candidatus Aenigmatarchaeota archaeon]